MKKSFRKNLNFMSAKGSCDFVIVVLVALLVIFGTVMIFSASYYKSISENGSPYNFLTKQIAFALTGAIIMYVASFVDYKVYETKFTYGFTIFCFMLLLLLYTPAGYTANNATRWILLGKVSIMPGEFAKLGAILMTAKFFSDDPTRIRKPKEGLLPAVGLMCVAVLLIAKQPNLSTALTLAAIVCGMLFIAGISLKYVAVIAGIGVIGLVGILMSGTFWAKRIFGFLDPFEYAKDRGFQVAQSLLAIGTGGLTGRGLGESIQKNLYLPEPQNDFIFSIVGEELGFIGALGVLVVFILLIWRCLRVTLKAPDLLGMLLSGGATIMIGVQVVFNVAVVTSSMPPTGVALPFISFGGNALWVCMAAMGIVLNVSRNVVTEPAEDGGNGSYLKKKRRKRKRPA